jgi:hypothetical protein
MPAAGDSKLLVDTPKRSALRLNEWQRGIVPLEKDQKGEIIMASEDEIKVYSTPT